MNFKSNVIWEVIDWGGNHSYTHIYVYIYHVLLPLAQVHSYAIHFDVSALLTFYLFCIKSCSWQTSILWSFPLDFVSLHASVVKAQLQNIAMHIAIDYRCNSISRCYLCGSVSHFSTHNLGHVTDTFSETNSYVSRKCCIKVQLSNCNFNIYEQRYIIFPSQLKFTFYQYSILNVNLLIPSRATYITDN